MSEPSVSWQAPEPGGGPAPGIAFASPGARLVGYIVDILIQGVLFVVLAILSIVLAVIFFPLAILSALAIIALAVGYFPYFWASSGQTPGMAIMKIKVVRDADGGPVTAGTAILRLLGFWVSSLVFYIGFIWIFVDQRRRGWMDLIAGTVVVEVQPATYTS
jgi:uncharacterized RDD family membrane protein YckC